MAAISAAPSGRGHIELFDSRMLSPSAIRKAVISLFACGFLLAVVVALSERFATRSRFERTQWKKAVNPLA